MAALRIRWRSLGKVVAVVVGGLVALQLLPGLLRPPEPPPLAPDVGLRGIAPVEVEAAPSPPPGTARVGPARVVALPGEEIISSRPRRRDQSRGPAEPIPAPEPPPSLPAVPPPSPAPEPTPPPTPPNDGSVEFAPH